MKLFYETYKSFSLMKEPKCYKNSRKPSCIDFILTNYHCRFQNSCAIRDWLLSDFHKVTVTIMKTNYEKLKPKFTNYRDYKNFCNDRFRQILLEKLSTENINPNCIELENFLKICINTLNIFAPCKKKYSRGNMFFMNISSILLLMGRNSLGVP